MGSERQDGPGRPELPAEQRRDQKLPVRFSRAEIQKVREFAERMGMGVSDWVRLRLELKRPSKHSQNGKS